MEKTIRVKGKGRLSKSPDTCVLYLNLTGVKETYNETIKEANKHTKRIKNIIKASGFKEKDLKTSSFNINIEEKSIKENDIYKNIRIGYRYNHSLLIDFPLDNELLGKILNELSNKEADARIDIAFTLKNKEDIRDKAIKLAIEDAMHKAKVIEEASKVKINEIINIYYSDYENEYIVRPLMLGKSTMDKASNSEFKVDIEAQDINIHEEVEIVYSFK